MSSSTGYEPSQYVSFTHNILHLNYQLQVQSNEFNISYSSQVNSYSESLLTIPLILAIFILQISLCVRLCCQCCRCLPRFYEDEGEVTALLITKRLAPRFSGLTWLCIISALVTLGVDQILIAGRIYLTNGINTSRDTIAYLSNLFTNLDNFYPTLTGYGDTLTTDVNNAVASGCSTASQLTPYITNYYSYIDDYNTYISPVPGHISYVDDKLKLYGIQYQDDTIWLLWLLIMVLLLGYVISFCRASKWWMRIIISCAEGIMIIFFILVGLEMAALIGLADFCMDPVSYVPQLAPPSVRNLTIYYTTCQGSSPLTTILQEAEGLVYQGTAAVDLLVNYEPGCLNNPFLLSALGTLASLNQTLAEINTDIACPPTQTQFTTLLEHGLCQESFTGFYTIWLGQYLSVSFLFLTTILVSLVYQYFGDYWVGNARFTSDDDEEGDEDGEAGSEIEVVEDRESQYQLYEEGGQGRGSTANRRSMDSFLNASDVAEDAAAVIAASSAGAPPPSPATVDAKPGSRSVSRASNIAIAQDLQAQQTRRPSTVSATSNTVAAPDNSSNRRQTIHIQPEGGGDPIVIVVNN